MLVLTGWTISTSANYSTVVPSKMNPVGQEGNIFSSLFDKVPARRPGNEEDIAGTVLYLVSRAGVSQVLSFRHLNPISYPDQ